MPRVVPASIPAALPTAKALAARLSALGVSGQRWAVALSGGPDSLALTALLAELNPLTIALIVDHGLRAESATEAAHAATQAGKLGLKAKILHWRGNKPTTGVMAAARRARYDLLLEYCRSESFTHLFLAHHVDDQAETVAHRQEMGSSWRGLAAMPYLSWRGPVALVRPLLDVGKDQLLALCDQRALAYVTDPSNSNPKYTRVRLRQGGVAAFDAALARARQHEIDALNQLKGNLFEVSAYGYVALEEGWQRHELALPLLRELLVLVGQRDHPPAPPALETAVQKLAAGAKGLTLAGCRLGAQGGKTIIAREVSGIAPLALGAWAHNIWWDRRWQLMFELAQPATLAPLGSSPWRHLPEAQMLESVPGLARSAWPVLLAGKQVQGVLTGEWQPNQRPLDQIFAID